MKKTVLAPLALLALVSGAPALGQTVSTFEGLAENFYGGTFTHDGIVFRDCNNVGGVFPTGETFVPEDIGFDFIIENSTYFYNDFLTWGSPVNTLTFGTAYVVGDNLSLGAFAKCWMDLPQAANTLTFDMAYYENGPWGGIQFIMEAYDNDVLVDTDVITLADGGGRDNIMTNTMTVSAPSFNKVYLRASYNGQFSAPRLMIDDLTVTYNQGGPTCGPQDFNGDGDSGTDQDIEAFFACLGGTCCDTCWSAGADFNGDGDIGTDQDIEAFFRVLGGGTC
ncbi:MAG TPA: hypothetical protein VD997_13235 [Phycisphaerales bacterium]|nr:hypothetical protein [Phycisphaerales bacterium]